MQDLAIAGRNKRGLNEKMKALIFSNGDLESGPWLDALLVGAELLIAADGGARHARKLGLSVHQLVGDMDSVSKEDLEHVSQAGGMVKRFPIEKDQTDLEIAVRLAVDEGASEIHILAAGGGRLDHWIGNALITAHPDYSAADIWAYSGAHRVTAVTPGRARTITTIAEKTLSIFPLGENVGGVSIQGVHWPLENRDLTLGSTYTISNRTTGNFVTVSIQTGSILLALSDLI